jgi:benzoyl-CoA reductase/2-hydroxyglutaryl-CoA dehydratase subunit BcrC/BadD/HgdB
MNQKIGFTCAYTPLPLIHAAGFTPFRIQPVTSAIDQAGSVLHDNMCPHVKRVLDRALSADLPELTGVVFMNSCESMRRLADAWKIARPSDKQFFVDLPSSPSEASTRFLASQLALLWEALVAWGQKGVAKSAVDSSVAKYNELAVVLGTLTETIAVGAHAGGRGLLQKVFNLSVSLPVEEAIAAVKLEEKSLADKPRSSASVPVYLFGNVLANVEAFDLLERSGCRVVADSLCTGSRQILPFTGDGGVDPFTRLASDLLHRPPCARTVEAGRPGALADYIVEEAKRCGARAVIGHVMKFCDPYLARIPAVREKVTGAGLAMLVLEGDCTLRSLGQSRTRLEAFVEMLEGGFLS